MKSRRNLETEVNGDEPLLQERIEDTEDLRLVRVFSWYHYFKDTDDGKKWASKWMKENKYSQEDIDLFNRCNNQYVSMTMCILTRMADRGTNFSDFVIDKIKSSFKDSIEYARNNVPKDNIIQLPVLDKKLDFVIGLIEDHLDEFYRDDYPDFFKSKVYDILKDNEIKASQAQKILQYYSPLLEEIKAHSNEDEEYSSLTEDQYSNYLDLLEDICDDINSHISMNKVTRVRKPRKKKAVDPNKLIQNVKYQEKDDSLRIKSISPINIVGANQAWLYNTKYKVLRQLIAIDDKGLSISGTSVINFCEKASKSKTLRKPEAILPEVISGTKHSLKKIFDNLTTKEIAPNGRINNETLLIKAVK
jgi:hypothetical protein